MLREARAQLAKIPLRGNSELDRFLRDSRRELSGLLTRLEKTVKPKAPRKKSAAKKKATRKKKTVRKAAKKKPAKKAARKVARKKAPSRRR